jgi:sugar/nucleoside kinase (ribokinase family)
MKKIIGLGNALTDILLRIENDVVLSELNLPKGSMQLIDEAKMHEIAAFFANQTSVMATGGSASNTINGIVKLGIQGAFFGKIGKDEVGDFFKNDSIKNGVKPDLLHSETPSGRCTVLVSSDGERTLCTYLGAACELLADEINLKIFEDYSIFHIEGYLVQNHELISTAVKLAKSAGLLVSIDLASYNVVESNLDFLTDLIANYVDIVFANEEEARAFTGKEPYEAVIAISDLCEIAIVKTGKDGSYIKKGEEIVNVKPRISDCIDTTGAGDLYASGFLYGLASGLSLDACGKIGSIVAGNVVEVIGAKMSDERWENIKSEIKLALEN